MRNLQTEKILNIYITFLGCIYSDQQGGFFWESEYMKGCVMIKNCIKLRARQVLFFLGLILVRSYAAPRIISVPVATVWSQHGAAAERLPARLGGPVFGQNDIIGAGLATKSDTQLLLGDRVHVLSDCGDWLYVSLPSQEAYNRCTGVWSEYVGWIEAKHCAPAPSAWLKNAVVKSKFADVLPLSSSDAKAITRLSLGTTLWVFSFDLERGELVVYLPGGILGFVAVEDVALVEGCIETYTPSQEAELRSAVCNAAQALVGDPYIWGGCSAYAPEWIDRGTAREGWMTGPDCSGLVYLAYRAAGLGVPRNAHPQFVKSDPISLADMQPGDLLFHKSAKSGFAYVDHVLLYLGNNKFIEASGPDGCVRIVDFRSMSGGRSIHDCRAGEVIGLARAQTVSDAAMTAEIAIACQVQTVELRAGTILGSAVKTAAAREQFLRS
jgi:gamma-D-glutamyl-L-lysine dipeptidyl-peptidase